MAEDFLTGGPKPTYLDDALAKHIYIQSGANLAQGFENGIKREFEKVLVPELKSIYELDLTKVDTLDQVEQMTRSLIDKYRNRVCENLKEIIFKNGKELTVMTDYDKISVSREELNRPSYSSIVDTNNGVAVFFGRQVDVLHTRRQEHNDPCGFNFYPSITDEYKVSCHESGVYNKVQRQIIDIIKNANPVSDSKDGFKIKKVIFNRPATIVFWEDGTKTVVVCNEKLDTYDPEKGLAMCFSKKALGNKWDYYNVFLHELKHAPKTQAKKTTKPKTTKK